MSNTIEKRDELLEAIKAPEKSKRRPSNFALYIAIGFANVVFMLLDIISAMTVYWLTNIPLYGVLTFLAGATPLLMHEFLYTRAFASAEQRKLAMVGAGASLLSITIIGVLAGVVNIGGMEANMQTTEILLIGSLVVIAVFHAILAGVYFYIDQGIRMNQNTEQAIARALQQSRMISAGDMILTITEKSVARRKQVGEGERKAAMDEVMRQLSGDEDGDGIPNYRDPDWLKAHGNGNRPQFASETKDSFTPPRRDS